MLVSGVEMSWEEFLGKQKVSLPSNPLKLSNEKLAQLDEKYPREGKHENVEFAEMLDAISQFERFEKRKLTDAELKLFRFSWSDRGMRDYLEIVNSNAGESAMSAVLKVSNRQHVTQGQANAGKRPLGMEKLNP